MKSYIAPSLLALATTSLASAIPSVKGAYFTNETTIAKRDGQICVQVQSVQADWYYTFTGIWGTDTGRGPDVGSFCVAANDNAGGAMYIGPQANPGAGSTKLECYFPNSGTGNCDVSLVDGYSLSMQCHASDQPSTIGGSVALYSQGNPCPDQEGPNCINHDAYNGQGQAGVNAFFQPAVQNGNNYCIFNNCGQDYSFSTSAGIMCTVDPSGM